MLDAGSGFITVGAVAQPVNNRVCCCRHCKEEAQKGVDLTLEMGYKNLGGARIEDDLKTAVCSVSSQSVCTGLYESTRKAGGL
jgi:hypothetical protein